MGKTKKMNNFHQTSNAEKHATTIRDVFEEFYKQKEVENKAKETLGYYSNCFKYFTNFISEDITADEIDKSIYNGYIKYLQAKGIADKTIESYAIGLRTILKYGMKEKYINEFEIIIPDADEPVQDTYSDSELKALLVRPNLENCIFSEYRDWVMINYYYGTGCRLSTATSVRIEDIDFDNDLITHRKQKNRKQHVIPLSRKLKPILLEYIQYRKPETDRDYLFCNVYGECLSKDAVEKSIRKYNKTRGVQKSSIHAFRHTFAKHWILNGGDMFRLQKMLNHSTLDMVKKYVHMFSADLQKNFSDFNPLDRMETPYDSKVRMFRNKLK